MKWVAVLVALVGLASARTIFDYERDGLENEQQGQPGKAVTGEYEWRAPDGKVVEISYVADHLGFRLVDDPETTAPETDTQSSPAQTRALEQEGEEEEEEEEEEAEEDEGAAEVRTEEELEEEEGEEESEGKSEGTEEDEESGSMGEEKSAEPEKEGSEAEASVEPEEKAEGEEKSADSEAKGAVSEEKSGGSEAEETEAEETETEGATKDAEVSQDDGEESSQSSGTDSSASDSVVVVAEAESKQTPVLVPVKVESMFPSETPVGPESIIATAEVLPPVAPLVAPMTVEKSEAVSPVVIDNVSFGPSVGPHDFVFVVVPPVEQDVTVADIGVVDTAPVAVETYHHSSPDVNVAVDSAPVEPVAAPNLLFALVASPEALVVPAEPPVLGKVQVSSPVGVPEIDSGISAFAVSQDSFQSADQRLSGSFDPVGNLPTTVSQFPVSEVSFETADPTPMFTTFNEVVEISPEPLSAPELPSPLALIQVEEVDPSLVSVEVSPAPNPRPDTNPSSLFNQEVMEVPYEEPQFINPIVPPPFVAPQVSPDASFPTVAVVLPSHRFDAPKTGRSMDSVPVFVDNSRADSDNALFFVPQIFQEEVKTQPSEVVEVVVPEENIMTIAKALVQPPPASAQPLVYTVESAEPQLEISPIFAQVESEPASVNDIPISLKDERFSAADVESSFVIVDVLPADPVVPKEPLTFREVIQEPVAPTVPEAPLFVEVNGNLGDVNPSVQTSGIVAPEVFALEVESSQIPVREEIIVVSEEPANSSPNAKVTIVAEDEPLFTFDEDIRVAKIQSPPLLPPLMKPSVLLS